MSHKIQEAKNFVERLKIRWDSHWRYFLRALVSNYMKFVNNYVWQKILCYINYEKIRITIRNIRRNSKEIFSKHQMVMVHCRNFFLNIICFKAKLLLNYIHVSLKTVKCELTHYLESTKIDILKS